MTMRSVRTISEVRHTTALWHKEGHTVALVPTMGALHAGHKALVEQALNAADKIVVSIFVNPLQFGPHEDFSHYPRTLDADAALLASAGAHLLYVPDSEEMYGNAAATVISVPSLSHELCGKFRPGHFEGVALVVTKLLQQVQPDSAVFGEKDYQQLQIITRVVEDLNIPVAILSAPTVREEDGLALSSRNIYLADAQRHIAPELYKTLLEMRKQWRAGLLAQEIEEWGRTTLLAKGFSSVDYCAIRHAKTLMVPHVGEPARILAAAFLGSTRLIDNMEG